MFLPISHVTFNGPLVTTTELETKRFFSRNLRFVISRKTHSTKLLCGEKLHVFARYINVDKFGTLK